VSEMEGTNWAPGLAVLASGVALFVLFLLIQWRRRGAAPKPPDEALANLDRRAQILIEQLKELNVDRHQLGDERYAAEKARLEQEAAAALRARDEHAQGKKVPKPKKREAPAPVAETAAARKGFASQHPQWVGALWGGGVVLFFVVLGLVLTREEKPRMDAQPPTGARPPMAAAPPAQQDEDAQLREALARLAEHPEDLELAARLGHELIRRQRFDEAQRITEQSLGVDPFHIEHRIHRAVLRSAQGQSSQALEELQHLAVTYPHAEEALLFMGGLRMETGDRRGALNAFERFLAEAPPDDVPPQLPEVLAQLRSSLPPQGSP
jgi:cytochrome c-type biogenesis protein CcmH/NrfG